MAGEDNAKFDRCVSNAGIVAARAREGLRQTSNSLGIQERLNDYDTLTTTKSNRFGEGDIPGTVSTGNIPELSALIGLEAFKACMGDAPTVPKVTAPGKRTRAIGG